MGEQTPAFMTFSAFAKYRGVSKPCITAWKRKGYIVETGGKVDVIQSDRRLAARPAARVGGMAKPMPASAGTIEPPAESASDPATWSRQEALRQREIAQARLAQIEADEASGLVAPIADFKKAVAQEYALVRAPLLGLASKLAHRLAAATTPEACGALVDSEVRSILEALTLDGAK